MGEQATGTVMEPTIRYEAVPTISKMMQSDALVRAVMGPRGSGKSTGMSMEIMRRGLQQKKWGGKRKTRFAVIRNTYKELKDTTLKTWLEWFPEDQFGEFNNTEMVHRVYKNDMEMEVLFRALDKPGDIKKLLSLELTGAWINEAREVPRSLINGLLDTIPRYPSKAHGGVTWYGIIMDTLGGGGRCPAPGQPIPLKRGRRLNLARHNLRHQSTGRGPLVVQDGRERTA